MTALDGIALAALLLLLVRFWARGFLRAERRTDEVMEAWRRAEDERRLHRARMVARGAPGKDPSDG